MEAELLAIREETRRRLGTESSAIFEAQACLLRDPELCDATTRRCRTEMINVEAARAECIGQRDMVIRVLDVGSDKLVSYFSLPSEPNPSLGQRGTRLLLNHLEILTPQLRAVLRLSASHRVSVLFPWSSWRSRCNPKGCG